MNVLITGGSGFIGKSVIDKLIKGKHSVMALSRTASELQKKNNFENLQWVNSSLLLAPETIALLQDFKPEVIIHLAWEKIPDFSFEISFENLQNHLLFFRSTFKLPSVKKIIVAGSCFEYNKAFGECLESEISISTNYFTWAKNGLRDFLQFECLQRGINLVWARIFYVYGPNQRIGALMPSIIQSLLDKKVPELKKPVNANDFIYVDDVAEGFIKFAERDIISGTYNLGSGTSTPVIEILRIVEKNIQNDEKITNKVLREAKDSIKEIDSWADMGKVQKNLNWRPETSLKEGIRKTIDNI